MDTNNGCPNCTTNRMVIEIKPGDSDAEYALLTMLRNAIRNRGGDGQAVLGT